MMVFMAWMGVMIFIPVFAPSLPILAWGEAMCGVSWGVFQVRVDSLLQLLYLYNSSYLDAFHDLRL
jgi:uncharacterized membrane protein